jgi:hypothetical protein
MTISISTLKLQLDAKNPRFVILAKRGQADIRRYLLTYEDVCLLLESINNYGSLLPGERIVALKEKNKYIVVEGNRRTCSLQLLLNSKLIPKRFEHKISNVSEAILKNCQKIEIDVLPDREAALALMSKRHIEGVKQWKPLAKKQFFVVNYRNGKGQSIKNLSDITGISEAEIRGDIRDYKLFLSTYETYSRNHLDFSREIIDLNTDPFWRLFKAKFEYPLGNKISPKDFFQITYDEKQNFLSSIDSKLFEKITLIAFEKAVVKEEITTRNVLTDIQEIFPLLEKISRKNELPESENGQPAPGGQKPIESDIDNSTLIMPNGEQKNSESGEKNTNVHDLPLDGGPKPGGPAPKSFFETISWHGKLIPSNQDHQGLLAAIYELHSLSNNRIGGKKAYEIFNRKNSWNFVFHFKTIKLGQNIEFAQ